MEIVTRLTKHMPHSLEGLVQPLVERLTTSPAPLTVWTRATDGPLARRHAALSGPIPKNPAGVPADATTTSYRRRLSLLVGALLVQRADDCAKRSQRPQPPHPANESGRRTPTAAPSEAAKICSECIRGAPWAPGSTLRGISSSRLPRPLRCPNAHVFFSAVLRAGRRPVRASRPLAGHHGRPRQRVEVDMALRMSAARGRRCTAPAAGWQPASASSACTGLSRPLRACSVALDSWCVSWVDVPSHFSAWDAV